MTVRFPKYVEIVNPALTVLYWIILALAILAVCANLIMERGWVDKVQIGQYIQVTLWVESPETLQSQYDELITNTHTCRHPESFDYWWDSAGNERYEGYQCVQLCPPNVTSLTCLTRNELFDVQSNPASAFLPTEYQDRYWAEPGRTRPPPSNSIVMAPELLSLGLMYNFEVPAPSWMSFVRRVTSYKGASGGLASGDFSKITSVFLDSKDEVFKILAPEASLKLTLSEILTLAGEPDLLDQQQPLAGRNMKPGGFGVGPYFRISGLELELKVECYWPWETYIGISEEIDPDSYLCAIRVALKPVGWVLSTHLQHLDGGVLRYRRFHGIRIVASTGGIFEFGDYNKLYQNLVSIVVVLSLPKQVLLFITAYLLGHMSVLYKRVIIERFNLLEQVAGMTTRLMSSSVTFVQLEDVERITDKLEDEGGISKKRMSERLHRVLQRQKAKLDQDEVDTFVSFCFKQVSAGLENLRGSDVGPLVRCLQPCRKKGKGEKVEDKNDDAYINIECFSDAYTSNEEISFASIIELFDKQRKIGILESLFMPKVLWEELHHEDLHLPTRAPSSSHSHTLEELKVHSVNMVHVFKSMGPNTFYGVNSQGAQSSRSSPLPQGSPRTTPMLEDQGLPVDFGIEISDVGTRKTSRLELPAVNDDELVRRLEAMESRIEAWELRDKEAQRNLETAQAALHQQEGDIRDLTLRLAVTDKNVDGIREYARDVASLVRRDSPRKPTESQVRSEEKLSSPSTKDSQEAAQQSSQVEVSMSTARDALEPFLGPLKKEQVELRQICSGLSERIRELDRFVSSLAHEVGQIPAQLSAHSASTSTPGPPAVRAAGQGYVGHVAVSTQSRSNQSYDDSKQSSSLRDVNFVMEPDEDAMYGGRPSPGRGNDRFVGKVNARHPRRSSPEGSGLRSRYHGEVDPSHVDVGFRGEEPALNALNKLSGLAVGESIHV